VVVRERLREEKRSPGRRLLEVPGYTFRLLITSCTGSPTELWREYNQRADVEKRIEELKYDLAADDFCLRQFFATEAVFCSILMLFNERGATCNPEPAPVTYLISTLKRVLSGC